MNDRQTGNLLPQYIRIRMNHNIITTVNLVQGDTAREFHFFFDDYIVPPDSEIRIYVQKPSGLEVYAICTLENNEIIVHPTLQMVAEKGKNLGQIQIINDEKVINTFIFYLAIEPNLIYSSSITSTNEFEIFNELLDEARRTVPKLRDTFNEANQTLSDIKSQKEDINEIYDKANEAFEKATDANNIADETIEKINNTNNLANDTVQRINDALENFETTTNSAVISITQPTNHQNIGGLWFVETVRE